MWQINSILWENYITKGEVESNFGNFIGRDTVNLMEQITKSKYSPLLGKCASRSDTGVQATDSEITVYV